ncbi:hypothetical protein [uncultured Tistrella sp.]|uniref:hypothetical protein n=1 Tax=Tistrella mobilis TaxID=171437 RepID=UPI0026324114|nr:hypothetical protein [uncultured Tistrella sp.]
MLNELAVLRDGLRQAGIAVGRDHPDVKAVARTRGILVRLDQNGAVTGLSALTAEEMAKRWTLRDGQHNSFPFLQPPYPLADLPEDDAWLAAHKDAWKNLAETGGRRLGLLDLAKTCGFAGVRCSGWPKAGYRESVIRRRQRLAGSRAAPEIVAVIDGFAAATTSEEGLLRRIFDAACDVLLRGCDDFLIDAIYDAFTNRPALYLAGPVGAFPVEVGSVVSRERVNLALTDDLPGPLGNCALSGGQTILHTGNFPQPSLPILGPRILFSRNSDIPAALRYGRADAESYPVGAENIAELAAAVVRITGKDLEGRSWSRIPHESDKSKYDLLLVYMAALPEMPLAKLLTGDTGEVYDPAMILESYGEVAADVPRAFDGSVVNEWLGDAPDTSPIRLSILRAVDKANTKIICDRAPGLRQLHDAARAWGRAPARLPPWLNVVVPVRKGEPPDRRRPVPIPPLHLPAITRIVHVQGGEREVAGRGLSAAQSLALLLDRDPVAARAALRLVLRHGAALLPTVGVDTRLSGQREAVIGRKGREATLDLLSTIAVLIDIIDPETTTMDRIGFRMGQLLAAVDAVHLGYCVDIRKGDVPQVLLGNSVLGTARKDPQKALALLQQRWRPYGQWATTYELRRGRVRPSKDAKPSPHEWAVLKAMWAHRAFRALCPDIASMIAALGDVAHDDLFHADLLLGYMAGLPPQSADGTTIPDDTPPEAPQPEAIDV